MFEISKETKKEKIVVICSDGIDTEDDHTDKVFFRYMWPHVIRI